MLMRGIYDRFIYYMFARASPAGRRTYHTYKYPQVPEQALLLAFRDCRSVKPRPQQGVRKGQMYQAAVIRGFVCLAIGDVVYRQTIVHCLNCTLSSFFLKSPCLSFREEIVLGDRRNN